MSAADLHNLELVWPSADPADVIVTGTFDQWSASIHLVKGDTGFSTTVKVPWGQKVAYKFIVDGRWQCRDDKPQEDDGHGNTNNVLLAPERPLLDPSVRLFITLEEGEGHGDVENMVTAVEFLPPAEFPMDVRPIPQIAVEDLVLVPSPGTPMTESKLNTAGATEGHVSPASETPAKPASCDDSTLPMSDNGPVSLPPVNGSGEVHDSYGVSTHAPAHLTNGDLPASPSASETAQEVSSESAVPEQAAQDTPALPDRIDPALPAPVAAAPAQADPVAQRNTQQATSVDQVSSSSTPTSNALTHKKRRSLFARIKHIFERDSNKREKKEKNKR